MKIFGDKNSDNGEGFKLPDIKMPDIKNIEIKLPDMNGLKEKLPDLKSRFSARKQDDEFDYDTEPKQKASIKMPELTESLVRKVWLAYAGVGLAASFISVIIASVA